jgi:hypothetical protein
MEFSIKISMGKHMHRSFCDTGAPNVYLFLIVQIVYKNTKYNVQILCLSLSQRMKHATILMCVSRLNIFPASAESQLSKLLLREFPSRRQVKLFRRKM